MEERVQPYADRIGADTYQPDPSAPRETWEQNQRDWINKQMDDGREIRDVGPDPARPNYPGTSSKWYQIERDEIDRRGYPTMSIDLGRKAMPIHIERVSDTDYTATATPSRYKTVDWATPRPIRMQPLIDALVELGYHLQDVADALDDADARWDGRGT